MLLQSSPSTEPETERTQSALHALAHQLDERGIDHAFCEGTLPDCTVMHNLDHVMPRMVIWPTTTSEVQFILAAIHGNRGLDRTPKSVVSGGHGYDGEAMCVGIAIDMQRMNACTMENHALHVESGCGLRKVIDVLHRHGRVIPHGDSLTVGAGGHFVSAGWDLVLSRRFGLGCRHVLEATIVHWDGKVETVNADSNPDLFLAVKGSFADRKGIVTSFILETHPEPAEVHLAEAILDPTRLPDDILHRVHALPDAISTTFRFYFIGGIPQIVLVLGTLLSKEETIHIIRAALGPWLAAHIQAHWTCHNLQDVRFLPLEDTARQDWDRIVSMTTEEFETVAEHYWKPSTYHREMKVSYCQQRSFWLDINTDADILHRILSMLRTFPQEFRQRIYGNITIGGGAIWRTRLETSMPIGQALIRFECHSDNKATHQRKAREIADAFTRLTTPNWDIPLWGNVYSGDMFQLG